MKGELWRKDLGNRDHQGDQGVGQSGKSVAGYVTKKSRIPGM